MSTRKGIYGLPDTYSPLLGGAQVAQTPEEAEYMYRHDILQGSRGEMQRLVAERERKTGRDDDEDD